MARSAKGRRPAGPVQVVLVRPPLRVPRDSYTTLACPPVNLALLAAFLLRRGVDVTVVDALGEAPDALGPSGDDGFLRVGLDEAQVVARVPAGAAVIGVTAMYTEEWPVVRRLLDALRRAFPDALLVAGGEHPSAAPGHCLADAPGLDLCVVGEGEETLAALVEAAAAGHVPDDLPGTAVRTAGGGVRVNARRPRIADLDALPWPAWDRVPLENYLSRGLRFGIGGGRAVPIVLSRGCPYRCTFCSSERMWTTRWKPRSVDGVLAEMEWLVRDYRVQHFDVFDLTAIQRRDWIVEFCTKLADRGWGVTWQIPAGTRTEVLDDEVTRLMVRSGARYLAYAPESGAPTLLKRMNKRLDLDAMKGSMRSALKAGLRVKCNLMIGLPDETRAEMRQTLRLCVDLARLGVHDVNLGPFCPYPGTRTYDDLVARGRIAALDDGILQDLASYSDLSRTRSWAEGVGDRELAAYRWLGMAAFYGTSFALHPGRLATLARDLATGRQSTRLARALSDLLSRRRRARRTGGAP